MPAVDPQDAETDAPPEGGTGAGPGPATSPALAGPDRPVDRTPVTTADLPATPVRDRTIPASAWLEAPAELLALGERYGGPAGFDPGSPSGPSPAFLRRVGPWLLWRAGPPRGADACHWAAHVDDLARQHTFRLHPDGSGDGTGPSGAHHTRFRTWKEDLRDHP